MTHRQFQICPLTCAESCLDTRKSLAMARGSRMQLCVRGSEKGRQRLPATAATCPCARVGTNSPSCRSRLLQRLPRPQQAAPRVPSASSALLPVTAAAVRTASAAGRRSVQTGKGNTVTLATRPFPGVLQNAKTSPWPRHSMLPPRCLPATMQTADPCTIAPAALPRG